MGNCCECDCACCCNATDSEDEKYPERDADGSEGTALKRSAGETHDQIELQETRSAARKKKRWTRSKSKHLKIDYFNKVATDLIQYKIAPYLFIYEQIGLSRINRTFSKLFNMSIFDYTLYRQTQESLETYFNSHIISTKKLDHFLEEGCSKVGTCKFMKLTKHEIKLILYFIIAQHQYDKAIHLWASNISLKSQQKTNCHQFISNLAYHITPFSKMTIITFSAIFNKNNNFLNYFIEPFSTNNMTYKAYNLPKCKHLKVLNLDFNQGINDKNCAKLFEKCIIPEICPALEKLNLSCTNIGDASCKSILNYYKKYMSKGIKLNKLILDDNYKITSYGVDQLNKVFTTYNAKAPINAADTQFRLKNELNKRNWRLFKPYWDKKIVVSYKLGTKGKGKKIVRKKNKPSSGGGSAF